jgi:hypothetical protein
MATRALKTNRSLANFASKKVLGKAMTNGEWSELQEIIPSGIQMSTQTIFGEDIPSGPSTEPTTTLWGVTGTVQYVELIPVEISTSIYDADADTESSGGDDTPQNNGPHSWYLKLPDDYEDVAESSHSKVGTSPFDNDSILYESLGKLQAVPTSFYLNPSDPGSNPYKPKIYYWDGTNESSKSSNPLSETYPVDWFFDPYNGIVFFQEYDANVIPYKVGCYIYIGEFSNSTTGGSTTLAALTDTDVSSPTNGQVLAYNSTTSKWEPDNSAGSGGIERYEYTHSGSSLSIGTDITVPSMDFNGVVPTTTDTQVFLNGQLLKGGSTSDVSNNLVDYAFSSDTELRVNFGVEAQDILAIFHITTSFSSGRPFITHTQDSTLDNALVLTQGDGITIQSGANPTQLVISNSGLVQRTKLNQTGLTHSSDVFTFSLGAIDFSTVSHEDSRIDVFVNGILQEKDHNYQFVDDGNGTLESNKLEWIDGSTPTASGRFTIIIF